ncbi:response regulator [Aurantivibrio plasticivorans]
MAILIVEDELELAHILQEYLQQSGFSTEIIDRGDAAIEAIQSKNWELILLDLMLPELDGIEICRRVRNYSNVPIIMMTARIDEIDRLLGLKIGADDYICKPYSPREVVARVEAVLRRTYNTNNSKEPLFSLNRDTLQTHFEDQKTQLTLVEFNILETLASNPGRIYSRSELMDAAYSDHRVVSDRTIDSHIKKLRRKLLELTGRDKLCSVYGVGYKLEDPAH